MEPARGAAVALECGALAVEESVSAVARRDEPRQPVRFRAKVRGRRGAEFRERGAEPGHRVISRGKRGRGMRSE